MKQAQLSIHFHWLFVLIIGVIILAFFLSIIKSNHDQATTAVSSQIKDAVDQYVATATTKANEAEQLTIAGATMDFTCETGLSNYVINGQTTTSTKHNIIFTPKILRGETMAIWTKIWSTPFDAAIFTYLADDRTAFIFVNDSMGIIQPLYDELPSSYTKIFTTRASLAGSYPSGMDRYVLITTMSITPPQSHTYERIIAPESVTLTDGTTTETRSYATNAELWGAIFTEDASTYDCMMDKALFQLAITARVLKGRADQLATAFQGTPCAAYLHDASTQFSLLAQGRRSASTTLAQLSQEQRERYPTCQPLY